jgi:hypothetical protein
MVPTTPFWTEADLTDILLNPRHNWWSNWQTMLALRATCKSLRDQAETILRRFAKHLGVDAVNMRKLLCALQFELQMMDYIDQVASSPDRIAAGSWALLRLLRSLNGNGDWEANDLDVFVRGTVEFDKAIKETKSFFGGLGYHVSEIHSDMADDYHIDGDSAYDIVRIQTELDKILSRRRRRDRRLLDGPFEPQFVKMVGALPMALCQRDWTVVGRLAQHPSYRTLPMIQKMMVASSARHSKSITINFIANVSNPTSPDDRIESLVEQFDLKQCAISIGMDERRDRFRFGGSGVDFVRTMVQAGELKMELTPYSFTSVKHANGASTSNEASQMRTSVERQMERVVKYLERGFRF